MSITLVCKTEADADRRLREFLRGMEFRVEAEWDPIRRVIVTKDYDQSELGAK